MINVTKPYLPPLSLYSQYLSGIWERNRLTNNGPLVEELELELKNYLGVKHLFFLGNGTIALQIAIKALDLKGEIITTPFSFVATTSSIVWEGCTPVFVDINPLTFNIDADKIENAITKNTSAILATHVYGNPCDVEKIKFIANKHNLKVIYDGAHAFGSKYKNESLLNYGDLSTLSFHATKLFHTVEGGAIVTSNDELAERISYMRNFGHNGPEDYAGVGVNGKNSEFHAAMGLCNLKIIDELLAKRIELSNYYDRRLEELRITKPVIQEHATFNYAYYVIVFETEEQLIKSKDDLNANNIFPRRYFYPSLSKLSYITHSKMEVTESVSKRVLCLPFYHDLSFQEIDLIAGILIRNQN